MTTLEQKQKKIETAEKQLAAVQEKLTKNTDRLANLESEYAETRNKLAGKVETLTAEAQTAAEHLEWVRSMPVSGRASGEVGAVETPAADSEE